MSKKQQPPRKLKYCVLICESLNKDYQSASPFAEIGNYPVIDYTLNWLAENNIEEVFLFYSVLKPEIEQYCEQFGKYIDLKLRLNFMKPTQLKSFGDVMREVRFRDLISQDFLVLYADSITNMDLSKIINLHFDKKTELKNVVLTTAMRRGQSEQITILNSSTGQILQVEQNRRQFVLNVEKVSLKKLNVDFRSDLVPVDLFICTLDVLKAFKQTEEHQNIHDFIMGMLTSEVYEEKIIIYELKTQELALRLNRSGSTYLAHMSFICNYLFPYSFYGQDRLAKMHRDCDKLFTVAKFHKIFRKGAKVDSSSMLSNIVYIGQNSVIEEDCQVEKSIIGKNVLIGKKSTLNQCIILDGVKVAENSHFQFSLLEKKGSIVSIHSFKEELFQAPMAFISKPLFQNVSEDQGPTFEDELKSILEGSIANDTIVVSQLVRIRMDFNKTEEELTRDALRILAPVGVKGIESLTGNWGIILLKVHHESQSTLMSSLFFACRNVEEYARAFHVFLQYFYHLQVLTKDDIISWVQQNHKSSPALDLCLPFVEKLKVESQQEDEEDDQQDQDS